MIFLNNISSKCHIDSFFTSMCLGNYYYRIKINKICEHDIHTYKLSLQYYLNYMSLVDSYFSFLLFLRAPLSRLLPRVLCSHPITPSLIILYEHNVPWNLGGNNSWYLTQTETHLGAFTRPCANKSCYEITGRKCDADRDTQRIG